MSSLPFSIDTAGIILSSFVCLTFALSVFLHVRPNVYLSSSVCLADYQPRPQVLSLSFSRGHATLNLAGSVRPSVRPSI